tara:strand:- start:1975 stop:3120 length:1146 start_codon:yes stop_codon:yes gene_type:complete
MKKFIIDFSKIILSTFILFILLNFIITLTWPIYTKNKFKNYKPYSSEIIEQLKMSEEDALELYMETWIDRTFSYSQFLEHVESPTKGKFVNISKEFGRKVNNPETCNKRFFLYGGSTTWGYNVADNQTIPAYLLKELKDNNFKDHCVYNFGGGSYFSTQENIRFQKHLLTEKIKKNDFIIFLDGHNEKGNRKTRATDLLAEMFKPSNVKFWDMHKFTLPIFIKSLPVIQLSNRLLKKFNIDLDKNVSQAGNIKLLPEDLLFVYQKNINIRKSICKIENLNCYSFLQPFATVHGIYFTSRNGVKLKDGDPVGGAPEIGELGAFDDELLRKYQTLKRAKGAIDISSSLDSLEELSWCDIAHYCPNGNEIIAKRIYLEIKDNLN